MKKILFLLVLVVGCSITPEMLQVSQNLTSNKLEISLNPGIDAMFHTSQGPAIWKLNLAPKVLYSFMKGTLFVFEGIIPLMYQFHEETKNIKLSTVYVNYTNRFKKLLWNSTSLGVFPWKTEYRNKSFRDFYRNGISNETTKFFNNGRMNLSLKADYTTHLDYLNGIWGYHSLSNGTFTWWSSAGYRSQKQNVYLTTEHHL